MQNKQIGKVTSQNSTLQKTFSFVISEFQKEVYNINSTKTSIINTTTKMISLLDQTKDQHLFNALYNCHNQILDEYHKKEIQKLIPFERLEELRRLVRNNCQRQMIFCIEGNYPTLRRIFLDRKWLEKVYDATIPSSFDISDNNLIYENLPPRKSLESKSTYIKRCENKILAIFLNDIAPNVYWNYRMNSQVVALLPKSTIINRFLYTKFSTKAGLSNILKNYYWFIDPGFSTVQFPRCYNFTEPDQFADFIDDFQVTASMSLLKTFLHLYEGKDANSVMSPLGTVPLCTIVFAINRCRQFITAKRNEDIDLTVDISLYETQRNDFLYNCYQFVHEHKKFISSTEPSLLFLENASNSILKEIYNYWPQFETDGCQNIWIMKPVARCRGIGIFLTDDFNEIEQKYKENIRYVCQKYIETPLLIFGHKFDIRQWFLVSTIQSLTIWLYKICYLRFSSKPFNLQDYSEVIHLTNNAIQQKYRKETKDPRIPSSNMWELSDFREYLNNIGKSSLWDNHLYPQIKQILIGLITSSEEFIDRRANCFQMFGADFMIDSSYNIWLLEINSCPQMRPSSPVTSRLCPLCYDDIVKVIVDHRLDSTADTGNFERIYKYSSYKERIFNSNIHLEVNGKKMKLYKNYETPIFTLPPNIISLKDLSENYISEEGYEAKNAEESDALAKVNQIRTQNNNNNDNNIEINTELSSDDSEIGHEQEDEFQKEKKIMHDIQKLYDLREKNYYSNRVVPLHSGRARIGLNAKPKISHVKSTKIISDKKASTGKNLKSTKTKDKRIAETNKQILKNEHTNNFNELDYQLIKSIIKKNFEIYKVKSLYVRHIFKNPSTNASLISTFVVESTKNITKSKENRTKRQGNENNKTISTTTNNLSSASKTMINIKKQKNKNKLQKTVSTVSSIKGVSPNFIIKWKETIAEYKRLIANDKYSCSKFK